MPAITPFLWFDAAAEEAANFYVSVFPNSRIVEISRYGDAGPGPAGSVMVVGFELDGQPFLALNGGPAHAGFTETVSFSVNCPTAADVDRYWDLLTDGGEEGPCGWLKDRFGLSWQIVPEGLPRLLGDPDPRGRRRAMEAMMSMKKLDLEAMERAAAG